MSEPEEAPPATKDEMLTPRCPLPGGFTPRTPGVRRQPAGVRPAGGVRVRPGDRWEDQGRRSACGGSGAVRRGWHGLIRASVSASSSPALVLATPADLPTSHGGGCIRDRRRLRRADAKGRSASAGAARRFAGPAFDSRPRLCQHFDQRGRRVTTMSSLQMYVLPNDLHRRGLEQTSTRSPANRSAVFGA